MPHGVEKGEGGKESGSEGGREYLRLGVNDVSSHAPAM